MGQDESKSEDKCILDSAIRGEFSVRESSRISALAKKPEQGKTNSNEIKTLLTFSSYNEYIKTMEEFEILFEQQLPNLTIKPSLEIETENSVFNNIDNSIDKRRLFYTAMSVYHQLRDIYGNPQNYPKTELRKIDFTLISRYLAYNYDYEEEIQNVTKKIIKRLNFFSEELPLRLYQMTTIFKSNLGYIFGYDKYYNLNFYIDFHDVNIQCHIPYLAYFVYIVFIFEHILPVLRRNNKRFSNKLNVIITFNGCSPNTELITFIHTYMNDYYPLLLNKMHIVNFNLEQLKQDKSFIHNLKKNDFFRVIVFHYNSNYVNVLEREISRNMIPTTFGGTAELQRFKIESKKDTLNSFISYIIKSIFINNK